MKSEVKHLPIMILLCITFYGIRVLAESYSMSSLEINYLDNDGTTIAPTRMSNETFTHVSDYTTLKTQIGNTALTTTAQTVTGAVNEAYATLVSGTLPNGANADSYWQISAKYYVAPSYTYTNLPIASGVLTIVHPSLPSSNGTYAYQTITNGIDYYYRFHQNSTWSDWQRVYKESDFTLHEATIDKSTAGNNYLTINSSNKVYTNSETIAFNTYLSNLNPTNLTFPVTLGVLPAADKPQRDRVALFPIVTNATNGTYSGYATIRVTSATGSILLEYMSNTGYVILRNAISKY